MKVTVTGATGTLGRDVVRALLEPRGRGDRAFARRRTRAEAALGDVRALEWKDPKAEPPPAEALAGPGRRGPPARRAGGTALERGREEGDPRVPRALHPQPGGRHGDAEPRPGVLVSQSASGWYGARGRRAARRVRARG